MSEYNMLVNGLRARAEHAATEGNMTATCDARYFAQSADAIRALEAEVERLKGALETIAHDNVPREVFIVWRTDGSNSKHDKCQHMRVMYEDRGNCISDFARSALRAKP